jgi:hypothetical protein
LPRFEPALPPGGRVNRRINRAAQRFTRVEVDFEPSASSCNFESGRDVSVWTGIDSSERTDADSTRPSRVAELDFEPSDPARDFESGRDVSAWIGIDSSDCADVDPTCRPSRPEELDFESSASTCNFESGRDVSTWTGVDSSERTDAVCPRPSEPAELGFE